MHVLCPSCATEYEIPPIMRPRKLRCAACGHEWRVLPPADAALIAPSPVFGAPYDGPVLRSPDFGASAIADAPAFAESARAGTAAPSSGIRRGNPLLAVLWALSLALVTLGLLAAWHWRIAVAHVWPPSQRLYRLLPHGLPQGLLQSAAQPVAVPPGSPAAVHPASIHPGA